MQSATTERSQNFDSATVESDSSLEGDGDVLQRAVAAVPGEGEDAGGEEDKGDDSEDDDAAVDEDMDDATVV